SNYSYGSLLSKTNMMEKVTCNLVSQIEVNEYGNVSHRYDGFGKNASDNNSIFLLAWLLF
ncbi:MAG: hypothetical protein PHD39_00470, partial [Methylobacter tundripaludum]|nr:hypothetical protein [Methylobacter tundripaludum]